MFEDWAGVLTCSGRNYSQLLLPIPVRSSKLFCTSSDVNDRRTGLGVYKWCFWDIHPVWTSQQPHAALVRIAEVQETSINKLKKLHSSKYYPLWQLGKLGERIYNPTYSDVSTIFDYSIFFCIPSKQLRSGYSSLLQDHLETSCLILHDTVLVCPACDPCELLVLRCWVLNYLDVFQECSDFCTNKGMSCW